ncbi:hypothetical protein B14911_04399 [Bacillus sp. NRRL B-14911]|uniref:Uncharacterized protein n=2 Tax=Bacillaceae TaxID=186817 RepID=U5LFQ1_9BACI|nr:hypothetical protein N288_22200 [Bacillus infantis NRRL B-14911]EAR68796.1 hypothetical protein B14911_04399 [Bacillus sp. NRRL B-14911]
MEMSEKQKYFFDILKEAHKSGTSDSQLSTEEFIKDLQKKLIEIFPLDSGNRSDTSS